MKSVVDCKTHLDRARYCSIHDEGMSSHIPNAAITKRKRRMSETYWGEKLWSDGLGVGYLRRPSNWPVHDDCVLIIVKEMNLEIINQSFDWIYCSLPDTIVPLTCSVVLLGRQSLSLRHDRL